MNASLFQYAPCAFRSSRLWVVLGWAMLVGGEAWALLPSQRMLTDHSLCCGVSGPVGLEGGPVRGDKTAGKRVAAVTVDGPTSTAAAVVDGGALPAPETMVGECLLIGFERLASFKYAPPVYDPAKAGKPDVMADQIPLEIKKLDKRKVQITGFMLPVKMEGELVSEMLLMRSQMMCCYGVIPQMNEWVIVRFSKPVLFTPDIPLPVCGVLGVGEVFENNYLVGLYVLEQAALGKR